MNPIVDREKGLLELEKRINELRAVNASKPVDMSPEIAALEAKYQQILQEVFGSLTPWMKVHMARHPSRPTALDYIAAFDRFDELHGDRQYRDDPSIVAGFAARRRGVMAIGEQRGAIRRESAPQLACRSRKAIARSNG